MNTLRNSSVMKLIIGLIVIGLLTGCAYFGTIGVGMTVIPARDWAGAVLNLAMEDRTQQVTNYYWDIEPYFGKKDKEIPQWAKERMEEFEATFDLETTNFRYEVLNEDGERIFGNYDGEAYIARSYDWEQRFIGTDIDLQRMEAHQSGALYDYENDVYLTDEWYSIELGSGYPSEYAFYDAYGNFYDAYGNLLAAKGDYSYVNGKIALVTPTPTPKPMDLGEGISVNVESGTEILVDGVRMYPIDPDEGYPEEFAYISDYGKIFDKDFAYIMYIHEYMSEENGTEATPNPTPTPIPVPTKTPEPLDLPKTSITAEEYEALYDAAYEEISVRGYILEEMTVHDNYLDLYMMVMQFDSMKSEYVSNAIGLGIGGLVLLLVLLVLAGKRNKENEYVASGSGRLPWDAWLIGFCCLAAGAGALVFVAAELMMEAFYYDGMLINTEFISLAIKGCIAAAALCVALLVGMLHSMAARVKVKGWWRNCLCWKALVWCWKWCIKILKWCWRLWLKVWHGFKNLCGRFGGTLKKIPLVWKAALILAVIGAVEFIFFGVHSTYGDGVFLALLWHIVKFLVCIIVCLMLKRLQEGARTIADGNLEHRIDTKNLYLDFKEHAECLNRIGDGLSRSVEAQLRSERMKTELITNVSHDLKTPLTSIVNYVDLLKKEELTGTAGEYVEVLDRQSARLKKLTEDLVEASKASTGSLQVNVERVSLTELIEQARAEYAPRLGENGLQSIVRQPNEEVFVWVDGKYVWRILDNLLSNVCKYAMPHTRVYLELQKTDEQAVLSVKNMSRESLNISAEELMERFVRGDSSRNTEGSGLGLSIAQNLAKLMGGEVCVTIDGDLFKAEVYLPLAK